MFSSGIAKKIVLLPCLLWIGNLPRLTAESPLSVQLIERPNGRLEVQVTNESHVPVTALLAVGTRTLRDTNRTDRSTRFFDVGLEPAGDPLGSGKSFTFRFFGPQPPPESLAVRSAELKAAIFADGSTWGDADSVQILLNRRRVAYECDADALKAAMDAKMQQSSSGALLNRLDELQNQHFSKAKSVAEKQMVEITFAESKEGVKEGVERGARTTGKPDVISISDATRMADFTINRLTLRMQRIDSVKPKSHE